MKNIRSTALAVTILLLGCFSFMGCASLSKKGGNPLPVQASLNNGQKNIETAVFTLDLSKPNPKLLQSDNARRRLVAQTDELIVFELINANPFKYRYVLNHRSVNFFEQQDATPMDRVLASWKANNDVVEKGKKMKDSINHVNKNTAHAQYLIATNSSEKNQLQIAPATTPPTDAKGHKELILSAARILALKGKNLLSRANSYTATISAADYLNRSTFESQRDALTEELVVLLYDHDILNGEAAAYQDDDFQNKYKTQIQELTASTDSIKKSLDKLYSLRFDNYTLPLDVNGKNIDAVEITLERFDNTAAVSSLIDKYSYNIWLKGGIKIDVSGGIFLTSLVNKEYFTTDTLVTVNDTQQTQKLVHSRNKGNYQVGFGSTINASLRGGSWVRPALSVGALFSPDEKFQLLSGLGLILGKQERLVFHYGLSMGSVQTISDNIKADTKRPYDLGTEGQIPTYEKFSFGHFFGLTYNFTKPRIATSTAP
ncbi:hypothetical protein H9Q13_06635 [Pontibacter sp. JH31]|uniref:Outer membrane protein beta-barrel domain-containing protein n=1 Tax=Pontibacter aquaedesilientis TaxID=2766980 RepID=A0ABR7XEW9_9BACT|nr:hypothetical protein [Pontibacter aquaedesilientis]MBD1396835.1 hypothetical protein [Pontibacter aquaedesilientis]